MNALSGTLVHIFDPGTRSRSRRWAYDIIEEHDWRQFRFKRAIQPVVAGILRQLVDQSPISTIYFYSDAQWSNDPLLEEQRCLDSFIDDIASGWMRLNTAIPVVGTIRHESIGP